MSTYTNDERFQVLHSEGSDDWTLQIKYVQKRDNGTYECQVSDTYLFVRFLLPPFREQDVSAVPASMIGPSPSCIGCCIHNEIFSKRNKFRKIKVYFICVVFGYFCCILHLVKYTSFRQPSCCMYWCVWIKKLCNIFRVFILEYRWFFLQLIVQMIKWRHVRRKVTRCKLTHAATQSPHLTVTLRNKFW